MEIKYQTTTDDYWDAQKYVRDSVGRRGSRKISANLVGGVFWFFTALGVISIYNFYYHNPNYNFSELDLGISSLVIGIIAFVILGRMYNRQLKTSMFDPEGVFRSLHYLSLEDDCIVIKTKKNVYKYSYGDVYRIEASKNLLLVFVDNGAALYIPKNAFGDDQEKTDFVAEVKSRAGISS